MFVVVNKQPTLFDWRTLRMRKRREKEDEKVKTLEKPGKSNQRKGISDQMSHCPKQQKVQALNDVKIIDSDEDANEPGALSEPEISRLQGEKGLLEAGRPATSV